MDDTWTSTCCSLKHNHLKYIVQVVFGAAVIAFSMFQIIWSKGDLSVYYSLLSGTLGLFLPSPGTNNKKTDPE